MRKDILLPGLAVAGGALGFGLRRWQWASAYVPDTQLFLRGSPATWALLGLTALLCVLFLLLCRGGKGPEDFLAAFRCPQPLYMAAMAASAFLFFGAGVLGLLEGLAQLRLWRLDPVSHLVTYPLSVLLCAALAFPGGLSCLLLGKGAYRGNPAPQCSLLSLFPAFTGLVWLFATHLDHGTDPVLLRYGFSLAAAALLMAAHYDVAAFFHGRPHPVRALFCALTGCTLGLISLADGLSPYAAALTGAFSLSALADAWALLRNAFGPPWPQQPPAPQTPAQEPDAPADQPD